MVQQCAKSGNIYCQTRERETVMKMKPMPPILVGDYRPGGDEHMLDVDVEREANYMHDLISWRESLRDPIGFPDDPYAM